MKTPCLSKTLAIIILFGTNQFTKANDSIPSIYPSGVYATIDDLVKRTPVKDYSFTAEQSFNSNYYKLKDINNVRIKKPFALSDGNSLFVHVKKINHHVDEATNRGRQDRFGNVYLKAIIIGDGYVYFENYFYRPGSDFLTALSGVSTKHLQGVIYSEKTRKFTVFRLTKDLKHFINIHAPHLDFESTKRRLELGETRSIMMEFFKINRWHY